MSEETIAALDKAIRDHVADETEGDAIVSAWHVVSCSELISDDKANWYGYASPRTQPIYATAGLLEMGRIRVRDHVDGDTDDD